MRLRRSHVCFFLSCIRGRARRPSERELYRRAQDRDPSMTVFVISWADRRSGRRLAMRRAGEKPHRARVAQRGGVGRAGIRMTSGGAARRESGIGQRGLPDP
ncbi:hypothetical protein L810_6687 [Burkholderia sp. AU4i]|nr:hypothetical protein L810_6687 [Burkholderia sp. AU4i]